MFTRLKTASVVIGVLSLVLLAANFSTWSSHDSREKQAQDKDTFVTFFSSGIAAFLVYGALADIEDAIKDVLCS